MAAMTVNTPQTAFEFVVLMAKTAERLRATNQEVEHLVSYLDVVRRTTPSDEPHVKTIETLLQDLRDRAEKEAKALAEITKTVSKEGEKIKRLLDEKRAAAEKTLEATVKASECIAKLLKVKPCAEVHWKKRRISQ